MRIGKLNTLLVLDKNTATTQGASGYITPTWIEQARVWCDVNQETGSETERDGALQFDARVTIEARWDSRMEGITPGKWRFTSTDGDPSASVPPSAIYDIVEAHDVNLRHEKLEVLARVGSEVPS